MKNKFWRQAKKFYCEMFHQEHWRPPVYGEILEKPNGKNVHIPEDKFLCRICQEIREKEDNDEI